MTFSAGRQGGRRVASPFAQRAAQYANAETPAAEDTPDISTIPDTEEPAAEDTAVNPPENLDEHPEAPEVSNYQEASNEVQGGAQEVTSEPVADDKPKSGRGRPKSAEVKERDERVYDAIAAGPKTRAELEEELGLTGNDAYMSLFRLRTDGRIQRKRVGGNHVWGVVPTDAENA